MNGAVDSGGRALVDVELRAAPQAPPLSVAAWIDTGFTGDLVLPQSVVESLGLTLSGTVSAMLADGSQVVMKTYDCFIQWLDDVRALEVVSNEGEYALLGIGLLLDRELRIDYRSSVILLE